MQAEDTVGECVSCHADSAPDESNEGLSTCCGSRLIFAGPQEDNRLAIETKEEQ